MIAAIGIIASIILGIVIMVTFSNSYFMPGGVGVLIGFLVMGLGSLLSWLSSLKLYAFGQLVESAQNIERKIFGDESVTLSSNDEKSVFETVTSAVNSNSGGNNTEVNKKYTCPNCGTELKPDAVFCTRCGTKIN